MMVRTVHLATRRVAPCTPGTRSQDSTARPMILDHVPNAHGSPGRFIRGIFVIDGDSRAPSILPPDPARRHPTQFRSVPGDRSSRLVYRRAR